VSDWFLKQGGRDKLINWLGLDAWLDSNLAEFWERTKDRYSAASSFFARFRLSGFKRLATELGSEALTIGAGGLVVMYALALPAFLEIDEGKWLQTGKYSVRFLDKDGNEIGKRGINLDDAVPLDEIPPHLIQATMATEDRRFFEHFGVDFIGTARALATNLQANQVVQGGSTLTQQLAKNLFLSSERSIKRKIKEVFLSFWLESRLTKREILKLYLDRAYMGGGTVGVEAAAQFYFGKSVRNITLAEAAMMAGLFKAPTKYAPHVNLPAARARANDVLDNLVEAGFYTRGQVHEARVNPAKPIENRRTYSPDWYLDWAYEEIQRVMEGRGHFVVTARTTVDIRLQQTAEDQLAAAIRTKGKTQRFNSGAIVAMNPDGAVRALVGGLDYGDSQFNRATQSRRQPGSSFKIYVYAAALENGYKPDSIVRDASRSCGNWSPSNYGGGGGGGGQLPLWMALAKSLNTTAAELSFAVGREKVIEMTQRVGIRGIRKTCSMALGDYGISPLEHTGGVAVFANGGKKSQPYAILEVWNSKNELVYSRERDEPEAPQIMQRRVAEGMVQMMHKVVTDGTGKAAALDFTHVIGKTGTSTGPRDVWFVGATGRYVGSVWLGNDDNRAMINGTTGGGFAAPLWQQVMAVAHQDMAIATLPGLTPHPAQVAEQQRLAELRRTDPGLANAQVPQTGRRQSIMPDPTREALKKLAKVLRQAAGLAPEPVEAPVAPSGPPKPAVGADRRADAPVPAAPPPTPVRAAPAAGQRPVTAAGAGAPARQQ
jgi:penicillin-binding protein 1A